MRAAQISAYGDAAAVIINEVAQPKAGAGQVVVAVRASSLNPFDTVVRAGYMKDMIPLELPVTLGGDIAGEVVEVGAGVTTVAMGDHVYGQANVVAGNSGAFAEFAATSAGQVAASPAGLTFEQAAALPLVGVSAWQALVVHLQLQAGQKIFIHGGGGGIGAAAIQLAKHLGAHVATTATGEDLEYVRSLGADEVIDYKSEDFLEQVSGYDAAFDTVGGDDFTKMLGALRAGGTAVSMIAPADEAKAGELGVTAMMQSTQVTSEALAELTKLVEAGVITVRIAQVFPLDQVVAAFEARESGQLHGKVVIAV